MGDRVVEDLANGRTWIEIQLFSLRAPRDPHDPVGVALDEPDRGLDPVEHRVVAVLALDHRLALVGSPKLNAPNLRVGKMDGLLSPEQDDPGAGRDRLPTVLGQDAKTSQLGVRRTLSHHVQPPLDCLSVEVSTRQCRHWLLVPCAHSSSSFKLGDLLWASWQRVAANADERASLLALVPEEEGSRGIGGPQQEQVAALMSRNLELDRGLRIDRARNGVCQLLLLLLPVMEPEDDSRLILDAHDESPASRVQKRADGLQDPLHARQVLLEVETSSLALR